MKETISSLNLNSMLPDLKLNEKVVIDKGEVFIHSPGFEDRTLGFKNAVQFKMGSISILLSFIPFNSENKFGEVRSYLSSINLPIQDKDIIEYSRFEPGDFESKIISRLREARTRRVTIDISTMSKLQIMLVLNACKNADVKVKIIYFEAKAYRPTIDEFEKCRKLDKIHQPSIQIFDGVYGVVSASSLASVAMQGQPTAAIVFMSFNDILTQSILNSVYPCRLLLINGKPPVHKWREEATAWIHDKLRKEWQEDNPTYYDKRRGAILPKRAVSTLYYKETVQLLLKLYWELSVDHRILLTPSGSKLQAVGCYLAKALHPDIHIEYSSPKGFVSGYSSGIGSWWVLDFLKIDELISSISDIEKRGFLEV